MKQLLIHSLVVSPIVNWITSPSRRWTRKFGINLAIGVLIVLALLQVQRMDSNCYELLGVDLFASKSEIAKAFRKQSITFHPDRPSPILPPGFSSSSEMFMELQRCYEIISSEQSASLYSRFGDLKLNAVSDDMYPIMAVYAFLGYVIHFIVCATLTSAKETKRSMYWITSFLLFAFSSEMYLKYFRLENLFATDHYFGWMVFEQINMLKGLIPSVLSSGILLSRLTYTNEFDMVDTIVTSVHQSNKQMASHIVHQRASTVDPPALLPAVLQLGKAPLPEPATAERKKEGTNVLQKILSFVFFAYLAKSVYNLVRSLI